MKAIVKSCVLVAMLAAFFVSNGITGSPGACSGSGNSCSGSCAQTQDPNYHTCCYSNLTGGDCACGDVAIGSQCP